MNQKNHRSDKLIILVGLLLLATSLPSCAVFNRYKTPEINTANLYRDAQTSDTTTIANIPWKIYFNDRALIALIEEGLENNADLQVAIVGIKQAEANLKMARAAYFPSLSLAGEVGKQFSSDGNSALSNSSDNVSLGVSASWELDLWGKLLSQSRSQYALFLKSNAYKNLIQSSLIANIATSYYALLALDEQLRITTETVKLLEENVTTMEALKTAGLQNVAAVEQSRSLMLSTKLTLYDLESHIRQMENSICVLIGREPGQILRSTFATQTAPGHLQTGIPAQLLSKRPDVQQAELEFRSAFELTNVVRTEFYPSITLNPTSMIGFATSGFTDFFSTGNLFAGLTGGLTQPIFNRRRLAGNLKVAQAQQEMALITFKNTVLKAGVEVSDILFTYQSSVRKNAVRQEQISSSQKAVEATQALLTAGEANYLEVLTAEQNHLSAQLSGISDKLEQLQAAVDLYRALGGGI